MIKCPMYLHISLSHFLSIYTLMQLLMNVRGQAWVKGKAVLAVGFWPEFLLLVARESLLLARIGCNVCVFTLCCFLAECCKAFTKFGRNKRRRMKKK